MPDTNPAPASDGKRSSVAYPMAVTVEELGIIVIALNSMTPTDHRDDYLALRDRLTLAWARRRPESYEAGFRSGAILPHRKHREELMLAEFEEADMERL